MESPRDFSPPDLVPASGFGSRCSLLVMPDHLLVLRHGYTKDKIERVAYDRVEHVVFQAAFPTGRLVAWGIVGGLLTLGPLTGLAAAGAGMLIPAAFGAAMLGVCGVRAAHLRNISLVFSRGGETRRFALYASEAKARAMHAKLVEAIRAEQARLAA